MQDVSPFGSRPPLVVKACADMGSHCWHPTVLDGAEGCCEGDALRWAGYRPDDRKPFGQGSYPYLDCPTGGPPVSLETIGPEAAGAKPCSGGMHYRLTGHCNCAICRGDCEVGSDVDGIPF